MDRISHRALPKVFPSTRVWQGGCRPWQVETSPLCNSAQLSVASVSSRLCQPKLYYNFRLSLTDASNTVDEKLIEIIKYVLRSLAIFVLIWKNIIRFVNFKQWNILQGVFMWWGHNHWLRPTSLFFPSQIWIDWVKSPYMFSKIVQGFQLRIIYFVVGDLSFWLTRSWSWWKTKLLRAIGEVLASHIYLVYGSYYNVFRTNLIFYLTTSTYVKSRWTFFSL